MARLTPGRRGAPKSAMAKRLNEAFAGCDQWTVAPRRERALVIPEFVQRNSLPQQPR